MSKSSNARVAARLRFVLLCCASLVIAHAAWAAAAKPQSTTAYSKTFEIDRIYRSMKGPMGAKKILLRESEKPELLWITGFKSEIVGADGEVTSPEFMCHANLNIANMKRHRKLFNQGVQGRQRLFTLSQGQMDVQFPAGFGIPIRSDEALRINTQVLNLNLEDVDLEVRHKTTIDYLVDGEVDAPMKPLFQQAAQGMVLVEGDDAYYNVEKGKPEEHGPGCAIGQQAGGELIADDFGRRFAPHWTVKPGREENRTLVTGWLDLPYDTTIHYIAVHLHPFATSLELRDLTAGTTIFRSETVGAPIGIGLDHVDSFSSEEGVPVYKGHEYELVSVYENTTDVEQDSMAVMFLYLLDKRFERPLLD